MPAVVLPKPTKPRSKAQLAAFEKARAARAANILKKKEAKRAPAPEPVEQPPARVKKVRKKQRVIYEESSEQEESSSDEDVLLVRRRKKPSRSPSKKRNGSRALFTNRILTRRLAMTAQRRATAR